MGSVKQPDTDTTREIIRQLHALGLTVKTVSEGTPGDPGVHLLVVIPPIRIR